MIPETTIPETTQPIGRTKLTSGARVVTETLPDLRSVAVGFWMGTGSRDEVPTLAGASHFLEHLLFKGTERRSASVIAEAVEAVGGDMNAFTTQETTAFYVRVPHDHLELAIEILSDIVWDPALRAEEVDSERKVILEEIRMRDDAPEDLVHDVFVAAMFPEHPIGRDVIGTPATIGAMSAAQIDDFHAAHYRPSNLVVAVAGNCHHEAVVEMVERGLGDRTGSRPARRGYEGSPAPRPLAVVTRDTEQAHVVLGMRSLSCHDEDRYALAVLNQAFGGGMSSRLFQEVREQRGLAYSVYSYPAAFDDTGAFAVSAGTAPERVDELLGVFEAQLERLVADGGVSTRELETAKGHLTGSMALSFESSSSRMRRLGASELMMGEVLTLDELVARTAAVTADDVARVVERVIATEERVLAIVGPFDEGRFSTWAG